MKLQSLVGKPFDPAWIEQCDYTELMDRYLCCATPEPELEKRILARVIELQPKR